MEIELEDVTEFVQQIDVTKGNEVINKKDHAFFGCRKLRFWKVINLNLISIKIKWLN